MIVILDLNRIVVDQIDNFNEFFECIITIENLKSTAKNSEFNQMTWNFVIHSPKQVVDLYPHSKDSSAAMQEAFEERLPLIEICTGDHKNPLYIVMTANVDIDYLKRKWCIDYCTNCNWIVKVIGMF